MKRSHCSPVRASTVLCNSTLTASTLGHLILNLTLAPSVFASNYIPRGSTTAICIVSHQCEDFLHI
ncbi:hypothetical protein GN244_ATG03836 [Phytophthora infestans]|uniref:Uncharacterized protein n=1 Tax=Phytophthora infestans TaxID=4787 RepID=A0A833TNU9_PHYIN|nr:hypothetical protein GN244_ATG03836 [Phytophthora infestans]